MNLKADKVSEGSHRNYPVCEPFSPESMMRRGDSGATLKLLSSDSTGAVISSPLKLYSKCSAVVLDKRFYLRELLTYMREALVVSRGGVSLQFGVLPHVTRNGN